MPVREYRFPITTTGSAGSATGSDNHNGLLISGEISAVEIAYHTSAHANTDVTITTASPSDQVLKISNNKTSNIYYPRNIIHSNIGGEVPTGDNRVDKFATNGAINVAVADSTALTNAVVVRIWVVT